jgi:hypothetical protein
VFVPALAGVLVTYLTPWCSRSDRIRAGARLVAATRSPRHAGLVATALAGLAVAVGARPRRWVLAAAAGW